MKAIKEMPNPTDVNEYSVNKGFILSDVPWTWSQTHEELLQEIKKMVREIIMLRFYDSTQPLIIQCSANEKGLGAPVQQKYQPLAYMSRALTDTETR